MSLAVHSDTTTPGHQPLINPSDLKKGAGQATEAANSLKNEHPVDWNSGVASAIGLSAYAQQTAQTLESKQASEEPSGQTPSAEQTASAHIAKVNTSPSTDASSSSEASAELTVAADQLRALLVMLNAKLLTGTATADELAQLKQALLAVQTALSNLEHEAPQGAQSAQARSATGMLNIAQNALTSLQSLPEGQQGASALLREVVLSLSEAASQLASAMGRGTSPNADELATLRSALHTAQQQVATTLRAGTTSDAEVMAQLHGLLASLGQSVKLGGKLVLASAQQAELATASNDLKAAMSQLAGQADPSAQSIDQTLQAALTLSQKVFVLGPSPQVKARSDVQAAHQSLQQAHTQLMAQAANITARYNEQLTTAQQGLKQALEKATASPSDETLVAAVQSARSNLQSLVNEVGQVRRFLLSPPERLGSTAQGTDDQATLLRSRSLIAGMAAGLSGANKLISEAAQTLVQLEQTRKVDAQRAAFTEATESVKQAIEALTTQTTTPETPPPRPGVEPSPPSTPSIDVTPDKLLALSKAFHKLHQMHVRWITEQGKEQSFTQATEIYHQAVVALAKHGSALTAAYQTKLSTQGQTLLTAAKALLSTTDSATAYTSAQLAMDEARAALYSTRAEAYAIYSMMAGGKLLKLANAPLSEPDAAKMNAFFITLRGARSDEAKLVREANVIKQQAQALQAREQSREALVQAVAALSEHAKADPSAADLLSVIDHIDLINKHLGAIKAPELSETLASAKAALAQAQAHLKSQAIDLADKPKLALAVALQSLGQIAAKLAA